MESRLAGEARREGYESAREPHQRALASPISVWEAALLLERGRLVVEGDATQWLHDIVRSTPAREAPLTYEVAVRSRQLSLSHADPADRFIVATAVVHDLTLVTADERILRSGAAATLSNG